MPLIVLFAALAACYGVVDYNTPMLGDDVAKAMWVDHDGWHMLSVRTLRFIAGHWLVCNGRILDSVGPVLTCGLPAAGASALMGVMAAVYIYSLLWSAALLRRGRFTLAIWAVAAIIALMPAHDEMWMRVCQYSYMWSTAICLVFWKLYFRIERGHSHAALVTGCAATALLTGFSHEETGVAACTAMAVYLLAGHRYRHLGKAQVVMVAALAAGTVLALASPPLYQRAGTQGQSILPCAHIVVTTLRIAAVLACVIVIMIVRRPWRKVIAGVARGRWIVYPAMAFVAGAVTLWSGVEGRTGYLPESSAMVALILLVRPWRWLMPARMPALLSSAAALLIVLHFAVLIPLQMRLGREYEEVAGQYAGSDDGIVYRDITLRSDFPWLALDRAQGVPDADDIWLLEMAKREWRTDSLPLIVLPRAFEGRLDAFADSLSVDGYSVYSAPPSHTVRAVGGDLAYEIELKASAGWHVVTAAETAAGRKIWVCSPLVVDKGDAWFPVADRRAP